MTNDNLLAFASNLNNWEPSNLLADRYSQFTHSQIKYALSKRNEDPALDSCCKLLGKRMYINVPMFSLWLANSLPMQKEVY
jgi:hypothetical protein